MPKTYNFYDVEVEFPFEAYKCQEKYMSRVVKALVNEQNALLESPTGTGKTLSLLCASLAWRENYMKAKADGKIEQFGETKQPPTIIYASRTHTQLTQVVKELKQTIYKPRMVLLASRNQLCIHEELKEFKGTELNKRCMQKYKNQKCHLYNNLDDFLKSGGNNDLARLVKDIEDLTLMGDTHRICPYYYSKKTAADAEMICMPYNYLLDPQIRQSLDINLSNAVILIDEAHNIENVCADAVSYEISGIMLYHAITEIDQAYEIVKKKLQEVEPLPGDIGLQKPVTSEEIDVLRSVFLNLEDSLDRAVVELDGKNNTRPGDYMFDFLARGQICDKTQERILELIDRVINMRIGNSGSLEEVEGREHMALEKFSRLCKRLYQNKKETAFYRCHAETVKGTKGLGAAGNQILHYWCMVPGVAMDPLYKTCRSVILTSGTLTPFNSFQLELRTSFPLILENDHVVKTSQFGVLALTHGPTKQRLNGRFTNRENPKYVNDVGCTLCNLAGKTPHGMLVFFTSYTLLDKFKEKWSNRFQGSNATVLERLERHKKIFFEPRKDNAAMKVVTEEFRQEIDENRGAIFFAVMRGKASEGLDFADRYGRCVVLIGIPFPNFGDPRVQAKRDFLDMSRKRKGGSDFLSGNQWYDLQASRAINQSLGRVIRHKDDFGLMILLGERFSKNSMTGVISKWLQPRIKIHNNFGKFQRDVINFFKHAQKEGWDSDCVRKAVIDIEGAKQKDRDARMKRILVCMEKDTDNVIEAEEIMDCEISDEPEPAAADLELRKKDQEKKKNVLNKEGDGSLLNVVKEKERVLDVNYLNSESYKKLVKNMEASKKRKKAELAKKNAEELKKRQEEEKNERKRKRKEIAKNLIARIQSSATSDEYAMWNKAVESLQLMKDQDLRNTKFFRAEVADKLEIVFKNEKDLWKDFELFISKELKPLYHDFLRDRFNAERMKKAREAQMKRKLENAQIPPAKRKKTEGGAKTFVELLSKEKKKLKEVIRDYVEEKAKSHSTGDIRIVDAIFNRMKHLFKQVCKDEPDPKLAFNTCVQGIQKSILDCHLSRFVKLMNSQTNSQVTRQCSYTTGNISTTVDPISGKARVKKKKTSLPKKPPILPPSDLNLKQRKEMAPMPKLEEDEFNQNSLRNPIVIDDDDMPSAKLKTVGKEVGMSNENSQKLTELAEIPPEPFTDSDSDDSEDIQLDTVKKNVQKRKEEKKPKKVTKFGKAKGTGTSRKAQRLLQAIDTKKHGFSLEISKKKKKPPAPNLKPKKFPPPPRLPSKVRPKLSDPNKTKQGHPQFGSKKNSALQRSRKSSGIPIPSFKKFKSKSVSAKSNQAQKKRPNFGALKPLQQKTKKPNMPYRGLTNKSKHAQLLEKHRKKSDPRRREFDEAFKGGKRSGRRSKLLAPGAGVRKNQGIQASRKDKNSFLRQAQKEAEMREREERMLEKQKEEDRLDRQAWDPSLAPKKRTCPICKRVDIIMFDNNPKCNHYQCYNCWQALAQKRKPCPVCEKWVNTNQLKKVM